VRIEAEAVNGYEAMEVFKKTLAQTKFEYSVDGEPQEPVKKASGATAKTPKVPAYCDST